jgi:hypothetical protein
MRRTDEDGRPPTAPKIGKKMVGGSAVSAVSAASHRAMSASEANPAAFIASRAAHAGGRNSPVGTRIWIQPR